MRLRFATSVFACALLVGCADPVQPGGYEGATTAQYSAAPEACWGQATMVFAQTGEMGQHASQESTPRIGLANLARALYDFGVIDEPTMQALGAYVAAELGLSIEACL